MTQANIIDQDADILHLVDHLLQCGVIFVAVGSEIHGVGFGLDVVPRLEVFGELEQFGLGARDEDEVVAFGGELVRVLFADAVGGAGHDGPAALPSEFG